MVQLTCAQAERMVEVADGRTFGGLKVGNESVGKEGLCLISLPSLGLWFAAQMLAN